MSKHAFPTDCPCGSNLPYKECCFMLHMEKEQPATCEALMRSRYSAFVMKKDDYLRYSWHPDTCPEELDLKEDKTKWLGLTIDEARGGPGDDEGYVRFVAKYKIGGRSAKLAETSRFCRFKGRWVYLDGEIEE